ncbi:MAG: sigma-70 family RNA polymerase sigma factor [Planctomycetaceae bacterium]
MHIPRLGAEDLPETGLAELWFERERSQGDGRPHQERGRTGNNRRERGGRGSEPSSHTEWGGDASDVTQEVLLRISKQLTRLEYDPTRSFRGWLPAVIMGAWSDWARGQRKHARMRGGPESLRVLCEQEQGQDLVARLEARYDRELYELAAERVQRRVTRLTWQTFERLACQEQSAAEVASALGVTPGGALAARARVQRLLREEVERLERSH